MSTLPAFTGVPLTFTIEQTSRLRTIVSFSAGDVKKLKPPLTGFRLRCGDYRVFVDFKGENAIEITGVKHPKEAYR